MTKNTPTPLLPYSLSPLLLFTFSVLLLLTACAAPSVLSTPTTPPPAILTGQVTIGPLGPGPVQLDAPTPAFPPEVYTTRGLQIFAEDGKTLITEVKFKADGTYRLEITPGTYVIVLIPHGIDTAEGLPKTITLKPDETLTLDINIDTGIR